MKINDEGLDLIKSFESCRLEAYDDGRGVFTVGFGHTGKEVFKGLKINQDAANRLLDQDLAKFESGVDSLVKIPLHGNQFSALVCLAFNIGLGAFEKSTLLSLINECKFQEASEQFSRWNKVNGKPWAGLTKRREAEKALFLKS